MSCLPLFVLTPQLKNSSDHTVTFVKLVSRCFSDASSILKVIISHTNGKVNTINILCFIFICHNVTSHRVFCPNFFLFPVHIVKLIFLFRLSNIIISLLLNFSHHLCIGNNPLSLKASFKSPVSGPGVFLLSTFLLSPILITLYATSVGSFFFFITPHVVQIVQDYKAPFSPSPCLLTTFPFISAWPHSVTVWPNILVSWCDTLRYSESIKCC